MKTIGYRNWSKGCTFWVANLKGKIGDWGYTTDSKQAINLIPYWQKRFSADCKQAGVEAIFVNVKEKL